MDTQEQRRLLELAAKAAGYDVAWNEQWQCFQHRNPRPDSLGVMRHPWVPNDDDGDNRRLQVALELELRVFNGKAHAGKQDQFWITEAWFPDGDPNAASRLAVLRAAAAIGERLEVGQ